MSKSSLLCSLLVVQFCIVQLCPISSWQLTAAGAEFLCRDQDPIERPAPRLMSNHGRRCEELAGHSADRIFDEELADEEGLSPIGEYAVEEDEGWLPDEDGGGGAKGSSSGSGGSGGDVECPECGKFFKNDKSMFGHLRSHPNRGYKGATPPVNKLKLSPEPETAAAASPSSPSPSSGGTDQPRPRLDRRLTPLELIGPYVLLTLQCRENSDPATQHAPPPPTTTCFRGSHHVGVSKQTEGGSSSMAAAEAHADEYSGSVLEIPKKRRNMLKVPREAHRKKAKLVPPPPPPPKEKGPPYICKHCPIEFPTHQALGGHMAGNHKDIKKVQETLNTNASSSRAHQGTAAQSQDGKLQAKGGGDDDSGWRDSGGVSLRRGLLSEQLSMASNVPQQSGQASAGQMIEMRQQHSGRRSDGLTLAAPAPAPAPAPTPTQAGDRGERRLLNIDLNAEATEQEQDQEQE